MVTPPTFLQPLLKRLSHHHLFGNPCQTYCAQPCLGTHPLATGAHGMQWFSPSPSQCHQYIAGRSAFDPASQPARPVSRPAPPASQPASTAVGQPASPLACRLAGQHASQQASYSGSQRQSAGQQPTTLKPATNLCILKGNLHFGGEPRSGKHCWGSG